MVPSSVCNSCRAQTKIRLRNRILLLQLRRRSYHATSILSAGITKPANSRSWYWDTVPPTSADLASATNFFRTYLPRKLWTATEWRKQNEPVGGTLIPEVAFLGRSNVGKSSLLNALLLSPQLNHVGPRPGKTTTMHAWGLAASDPVTGGARRGYGGDTSIKIAVLDMPGYGHASHGDWGQEIITYLRRRKQLKRVFVLLDALHGVKPSDLRMLDLLRRTTISHQVIASKCDRLGKKLDAHMALDEALARMRHAVQPESCAGGLVALGEILAVGALGDGRKNDSVSERTTLGIEEVRYAVLKAAGLESTNSPESVIPTIEGKQPRLMLDWKTSVNVTGDKAVPPEQTSSTAYDIGRCGQGNGDGPVSGRDTVFRIQGVEDTTRAVDDTRSATFEPFASSQPPRGRAGPQKLIREKKVDRVLPDDKKKGPLAIDKADKAAAELPSSSAQRHPFAGSIGHGLRDLYAMTATGPSRDTKATARRQQRRRREAC